MTPITHDIRKLVMDAAVEETGIRWDQPHTHYSPLMLVGWMKVARDMSARSIPVNDTLTLHTLAERRWPAYFLSQELIDALNDTKIADDYPLEHLRWPHEAMLFGFPRKDSDDDNTVTAMSVCHYRREAYKDNIRGKPQYEHCDRLGIIYSNNQSDLNTGAWPLAKTFKAVADDYLDVYTSDRPVLSSEQAIVESKGVTSQGEFALKLLIYLNIKSVPDSTRGVTINRLKRKRSDELIEVRRPIMLDHVRKYTPSYDSTPTGIKLKGHFRKGHLRGVWHGSPRNQLVTQWIEAYPVGSYRDDYDPEADQS